MYRTSANESRGATTTTSNEFPIDISSDEDELDDAIPKIANNGTQLFHTFSMHNWTQC